VSIDDSRRENIFHSSRAKRLFARKSPTVFCQTVAVPLVGFQFADIPIEIVEAYPTDNGTRQAASIFYFVELFDK
jgi:hypothetical protein